MDYDKLIFTIAVALIGGYAVYNGNDAVAGTCLGIMGAILRPGTQVTPNSNVSSTTVITPKGETNAKVSDVASSDLPTA